MPRKLTISLTEDALNDLFSECLMNGIRGGLLKSEKREYMELDEDRVEDAVEMIYQYVRNALDEDFEINAA
jgi:hypothetical protein